MADRVPQREGQAARRTTSARPRQRLTATSGWLHLSIEEHHRHSTGRHSHDPTILRLVRLPRALWSLPAARAEIQVGAAVRVITPDPLLPVSGGMGTPNPAREKRGEITARAIVFRKGDVSVAIVSLDLLGFPSVLGDRVRAKVSRIPADHILIGSTHTHSAPDCYAFPDGKGGHTGDLKYMDLVCDKAAEAVNEAIDRLQPASIKIATGEAQGKIAYNYYAPDLYDRRMSVIQAVSPRGQDDRHARQLRGPSGSSRQRRRHSQPRPGRPSLREDRITWPAARPCS